MRTEILPINTSDKISSPSKRVYGWSPSPLYPDWNSINESIFGVLPSITLDYAKKTTATLGKIGVESTENLVSGGIEFNLGLCGLGASLEIHPPGNITLNSVLGPEGITGSATLGNVSFDSLAGYARIASVLSTMKLES